MAATLARLGLSSVKQVQVQFHPFEKWITRRCCVDLASSHHSGNAHCLCLPHCGQRCGKEPRTCWYWAMTVPKRPTS
uniref:Uncharacterized protein n=1 Tax=Theropithecus gelada TaxID=9565 RepID=A0A8D2EE36_THEGE